MAPKLLRLAESTAYKFLPRKVVKHYLRPLMVQLFRRERRLTPYDAKRYFESWHRATLDQEFSDGITIDPNYNPIFARYHYNAVENSIIESFVLRRPPTKPKVLDIGSGAGHWIDFYLNVFHAMSVVGIEISEPCADALRLKYENIENVLIMESDISSSNFNLGKRFDIINAIGVMFHIVDDGLWRQAIKNLANHLNDNGIMVIGGQFGWVTQNVNYVYSDNFSSWEEVSKASPEAALVIKRIRSLRLWKECAQQAGLRIECVQRTRQRKGIVTPENNILILSHNRL